MLVVGQDDLTRWGDVVVFGEHGQNVVAASGDGWRDYKSAEKVSDGPCNLAMTHVPAAPVVVKHMERHDHTLETLFCGADDICLAVCASEHEVPLLDEVVPVLIPKGTAFVMHRGTWHSPCFGAATPTAYYWMAVSDPRYPSEWIDIRGGGFRLEPSHA